MSGVGYDLDTSGGLMPLIRALIKPPDEESNGSKAKKPQHPYYKRPGKGHNHDSCDACGEGGDLICCDRCPASFHLGCYDPPLDENDIPAGQWLCKECMGTNREPEKPPSSRSSRAQSPADSDKGKSRILRNNRSSSTHSKKKSKEESKEGGSKEEEDKNEVKEEEKELTPMEALVKAARIMNPRQFELPREMRVPCPFPGTDRDPGKSNPVISVDSGGCVPLPAKSCFVCAGTCKAAPLLQCDYCPLLFHQDCLDPPLTALPTGRWMCPNHVEQYIDWKLVNSISATERVALWDRFSGPVDQHAIKVDFLRRARNKNPMFRLKVPVSSRRRVEVPPMVMHHYRNPPPLLPSRREHVRCRNVLKQLQASGEYTEEEPAPHEPKHQICLNPECPTYAPARCSHQLELQANKIKMESSETEETLGSETNKPDHQSSDKDPKAPPAKDEAQVGIEVDRDDEDTDSLSGSELEELARPPKRRKTCPETPTRKKNDDEVVQLRVDDSATAAVLRTAEAQLRKLDSRLVTLLAWQRLQQILSGEALTGSWRSAPLSAAASRAVAASLGPARARFVRHSLPSQMLSKADRYRISKAVWGKEPEPSAVGPDATAEATADEQLRDAAVVAALLYVDNTRTGTGAAPVAMRGSSLSVGGASCDVWLRKYRRCRRQAPIHATIFRDQVSGHFEMINYSEWGSLVNGVLYAADTGAAPPPRTALLPARRREKLNGELTQPEPAPVDSGECLCGLKGMKVPGAGSAWEGAALLAHGDLLQFGCAQFVFCITDAEGFPYANEGSDKIL